MEAESTVATPLALASTVNALDRRVDPQHLRSMAHQYIILAGTHESFSNISFVEYDVEHEGECC